MFAKDDVGTLGFGADAWLIIVFVNYILVSSICADDLLSDNQLCSYYTTATTKVSNYLFEQFNAHAGAELIL